MFTNSFESIGIACICSHLVHISWISLLILCVLVRLRLSWVSLLILCVLVRLRLFVYLFYISSYNISFCVYTCVRI